MSQHTSWLMFSSPWLSDSWSHGPSFNTCLWWLIGTSTLAFWISSHYSALTYTHSSNVRIPTSFQKLSPSSFSKGTLGTHSPEHLWVCAVVPSWGPGITPSTSSPHLPAGCLHQGPHEATFMCSWEELSSACSYSAILIPPPQIHAFKGRLPHLCHPPCGRLCVLSLVLSFSVWLWSIHGLLASLILRQREKMP